MEHLTCPILLEWAHGKYFLQSKFANLTSISAICENALNAYIELQFEIVSLALEMQSSSRRYSQQLSTIGPSGLRRRRMVLQALHQRVSPRSGPSNRASPLTRLRTDEHEAAG